MASTSLRGDVAGGITSAVLTLPVAAGLGILALSPLGAQYVPYGILAGVYCAVVLPLGALLAGARGVVMYSPRSVLAFLLASLALRSLASAESSPFDLNDVPRTLTALFFAVFLAGLFQAAFGVFRFGALVKYIPSPVMAGFQNAGAILIFFAQIDALLGFAQPVPLLAVPASLGHAQPLTALVGLVTIATMVLVGRLSAFPPTVAGLLAGSVTYHGQAAVLGGGLGPVVGHVPSSVPLPAYAAAFAGLVADAAHWRTLAVLASGGLSLAIIASLDGLLSAKTRGSMTGQRTEGNRTLLELGIGNMAVACFGGTMGGLNIVGSLAAERAGARSRLAVLASAVAMLIAVVALAPLVGMIPRVVIAGMLAVLSVQFVDRWPVEMILKLARGRAGHWRRMALDLFVVALVATAAITLNLVAAVGIGVAVAVLSFLFRMTRSVVRRVYPGSAIQSRRTREPRLMELLSARGDHIMVFELEGPLFFGTAEDLARRVEAVREQDVRFVILDFKWVNEVDSTGARILRELGGRLAAEGRRIVLSHVTHDPSVASVLDDMGVTAGGEAVFADIDRALEWAEDQLLAQHAPEGVTVNERPFEALDMLDGLDEAERVALARMLTHRAWKRGDVVFREGDPGQELYLISAGAASVTLQLAGLGRQSRLATFSAGTVFGELALLDPSPRSATIVADDDLVCYVLTEEAFERLRKDHPRIAIALLTNLGRELTRRLRRATRTIYQLEG